MALYNKLFNKSFLKEAADIEDPQISAQDLPEDTNEDADGLISPYSLPRKDITALAIDELESEGRILGFTISRVYSKIAPSIMLVKKIDTAGFNEFKSRLLDTMDLNNILSDNSTIKDHLADIFTWAYAKTDTKDLFLVYSDKRTVENIARAIYKTAVNTGLKLPQGKISELLIKILEKVLYKPKPKNSHESK